MLDVDTQAVNTNSRYTLDVYTQAVNSNKRAAQSKVDGIRCGGDERRKYQ
jgi:hypothetical protein